MSSSALFVEQLSQRIASQSGPFLARGAGTKPGLLACAQPVQIVDMREHSGIVSYDASEYLISAKAGTTVLEVERLLHEHGQYLPFDPLYGEAGSTLGGAVAGGLSGPSRMLYGSVRDFVMEIEFIDGLGKPVRGGGKVVKNAAGFDLPKLLVGSYGRLGILTEITLKVFPKPAACATLSLEGLELKQCLSLSQTLLAQALPIAALDFAADAPADAYALHIRFAGPPRSLDGVLDRARGILGREIQLRQDDAEIAFWRQRKQRIETTTPHALLRIGTAPDAIPELASRLSSLGLASPPQYSCAGAVAYVQLENSQIVELDCLLRELALPAVLLHGDIDSWPLPGPFVGQQVWREMANRIRMAIDPHQRFPTY